MYATKTHRLFKGASDIRLSKEILVTSGIRSLLKQILYSLRYRYQRNLGMQFDHQFNVETEEHVVVSELIVPNGDKKSASFYGAVDVSIFPLLMSALPRELGDFVFVDFGCGKGR